jgi:hypothetical protein
MLENINGKIYFRAVVIMAFLFTISFFFAFAHSEGAEGSVYEIMSIPAEAFGVPFLWLFFRISEHLNPVFLCLGIVLDIWHFALVTERLIYFLKRLKTGKKTIQKQT